jgi:hypothetical protein
MLHIPFTVVTARERGATLLLLVVGTTGRGVLHFIMDDEVATQHGEAVRAASSHS